MILHQDRQRLRERCETLYEQKDAALDAGLVLSWDYDRNILILIRDILIHSRDHWAEETGPLRRDSLNNIVLLSLLLRRQFKCIYNADYPAQGDQGEEINIWRNLDFLVQYQITEPDSRFHQPLVITFIDINDLLQELFDLIDTVLNEEIRVGLKVQNIFENSERDFALLPLDKRNRFQRHDINIRKLYRNPHRLPLLEAFAMFGREKLRIHRILRAIQFAGTIDFAGPDSKMSFLRQLQIVGESGTGKNFSVFTRRLRQDIDWQLLIRLRNKLSHNEWDIHRDLLTTEVTTERLQRIQDDLTTLEVSIQLLQKEHNEIGTRRERILRHYDPACYLRPATRQLFFDFIRDCYIARIINRIQLVQLRNLMISDIRNRDILGELRTMIAPVFDRTSPRYVKTLYLLRRYQPLSRSYSNELRYHRNLENPDVRTQRQIDRRLASHQQNIRVLHDALNYTQETYNHDLAQHPDSFNPIRIINFIREELRAIRTLLFPLPGSEAVTMYYPEDVTILKDQPDSEYLTRVFNIIDPNASPPIRNAITQIRNYCQAIGEPPTLLLNGLQGGIRRGEIQKLSLTNINIVEYIRRFSLLRAILNYGKKCLFYNSLLQHPEIVEACFYHLGRIQKYTVVLRKSPGVRVDRLPNFEEFKALRNFIQHGCTVFEILNIEPLELMVRYASLFLRQLSPAIDQTAIDLRRPISALLVHGLLPGLRDNSLTSNKNRPGGHVRSHSL